MKNNMKINKQLWQGDVGLKRIEKLPDGLKEKDRVLALGEATGHSHRFESPSAIVMIGSDGRQYVQTREPCELVHEEHGIITVPIGCFEVILQREYDVVDGVRQVMD